MSDPEGYLDRYLIGNPLVSSGTIEAISYNYVADMVMTWIDSLSIDIGDGSCKDDSNTEEINFALAKSFSFNNPVGIGGLDSGAIASNTPYFLFAVKNPSTESTGLIGSTSRTSPALPAGWTLKRRIAEFMTNGVPEIPRLLQFGTGRERRYQYWDSTPTWIINGVIPAAGVWTNANSAAFVPPGADRLYLWSRAYKAGGGNFVLAFRKDASLPLSATGNVSYINLESGGDVLDIPCVPATLAFQWYQLTAGFTTWIKCFGWINQI